MSKEKKKNLMVISDGFDSGSTLSTNSSDYLETLKNTVKWIENRTNIELLVSGWA